MVVGDVLLAGAGGGGVPPPRPRPALALPRAGGGGGAVPRDQHVLGTRGQYGGEKYSTVQIAKNSCLALKSLTRLDATSCLKCAAYIEDKYR